MENIIILIKQNPLLAIAVFIVLFIIATIIRRSLKLILTLIIMIIIIAGILMYNEDFFKEENIKSLRNIDLDDLKKTTDKLKSETKDKILKQYKKSENNIISEENGEQHK